MRKTADHTDRIARAALVGGGLLVLGTWSARAALPDPRYLEEPLPPAEAQAAGLTCPKAPFALLRGQICAKIPGWGGV